jgi:RNA polymerase sigma factor (sigma-70 family)
MARISSTTAQWLATHALPHEAGLRAWLGRKRVVDLPIDDIVQETYAILAARADLAQVRSPRSYMFQVAYSVILRHVRRSRIVSIQVSGDLDRLEIAMDAPSPEQEAADRDDLRQLAEAISAMPPQTRRAFVLRRVRGLSQRDIAREMGLSENTVEKHIARGMRLLSKRFGRGGTAGHRASIHHEAGSNGFEPRAREQSDD